jgi:lysophospholipase L1-like esterase
MPQLQGLAVANEPGTTWHVGPATVPDVVVVLLGANDYSTPPAPSFASFQAGYNALLDAIEGAYAKLNPHMRIVCSCGPFSDFCYNGGAGLSYVQRIVEARADKRVSFVSLNNSLPDPSYPGPYTGCDGHPNQKGAIFMAQLLRDHVYKQ